MKKQEMREARKGEAMSDIQIALIIMVKEWQEFFAVNAGDFTACMVAGKRLEREIAQKT